MAYNRNKVILYGAVGIILALTVIAFIPTRTETHITTGVNLNAIPGYGIQIIKISEDSSQITHLVLYIQSIEAQMPDGEWATITQTGEQWDIRQEVEKIIPIDPDINGYSKVRLNIATNSTVTLGDGQEVQFGVPSIPIMVDLMESHNNTGTEIRLLLSQGTGSNYMLPNLQIELSTSKLTAEIIDQ